MEKEGSFPPLGHHEFNVNANDGGREPIKRQNHINYFSEYRVFFVSLIKMIFILIQSLKFAMFSLGAVLQHGRGAKV